MIKKIIKIENSKIENSKYFAITVSLFYILVVGLWFLIGDHLLMFVLAKHLDLSVIMGIRYWSIVILTAVMLYTLIRYQLAYRFTKGEILTERKQAEEKIKVSQKAYEDIRYALDQSAIVAITDAKGIIQYANDTFCKISKFSREELIGSNHRIINSGYHPKEFFRDMWKTISSGQIWKGEIRNKAKDGSIYWVSATIVPFMDELGKPYQYIVIRKDITEIKLAEEKIEYLAYHDSLTGLPNRLQFFQYLNQMVPSVNKNGQELAVLYLDLDRFKFINDSLGHTIGDQLIQKVAERLQGCFQSSDMLARMGGDEFTAVLFNTSKQEIQQTVECIQQCFQQPFYIQHHELFVTLSMGISFFPDDAFTVNDLIKNADIAMYFVKADGGDNYRFYSHDMQERVSQKVLVEKHLRKAIENNELIVYYQPQIDIHTGQLEGMEALVRWKHSEWGIVPPAHFIPVAEETGLIVAIGEQVLRQACKQNKVWQEMGLRPVRVAVNLSVQQFKQRDFKNLVQNILAETGLDPKYLELEITESIAMQNSKYVIQTLHQLVDLGIYITVDDFGTGYSSLNYLQKYPIKCLKIDRSFVKDIPENKDNIAITRAIIQLAKSLDLKVVAEGVETAEQLSWLRKYDCDIVQGFLYGKPMDAEDFEAFLRNGIVDSAS